VQPVNQTTDGQVTIRVCNISGADVDTAGATYTFGYGVIR
jgi:hypothetical protein